MLDSCRAGVGVRWGWVGETANFFTKSPDPQSLFYLLWFTLHVCHYKSSYTKYYITMISLKYYINMSRILLYHINFTMAGMTTQRQYISK